MNEKGEFIYNNVPCSIVYENKKFYITVFKDNERLFVEKDVYLFPVPKFSKGQQLTAFHIANLHILPKLNIQ